MTSVGNLFWKVVELGSGIPVSKQAAASPAKDKCQYHSDHER